MGLLRKIFIGLLDRHGSEIVKDTSTYESGVEASIAHEASIGYDRAERALADVRGEKADLISRLAHDAVSAQEELARAREEFARVGLKTQAYVEELERATSEVVAGILVGSKLLSPSQIEGLNLSLAKAFDSVNGRNTELLLENKMLEGSNVANVALAYASLSRKFAKVPLAVHVSGEIGYVSGAFGKKRYRLSEFDLLTEFQDEEVREALDEKGVATKNFDTYVLHFSRHQISREASADVVYLVPVAKKGMRSRVKLLKGFGEEALRSLSDYVRAYKNRKSSFSMS